MIKENLVKISENMYEIPKQSGMNVPGKIFVSEKLLNDIEEDALKQVVNVAKLSGIVGYSIGMSDMHVGYGFPIGGVAAFDFKTGVISPGGVGYDINCLSGDSKILTEFGYWKKIKDFEENFEKESLPILGKEDKRLLSSKISLFMNKHSDKIIRIKTKSGREISATREHPFYTKNGMKAIEEIKEGNEILLYP